MNFQQYKDPKTDQIHYHLIISGKDLLRANLSEHDIKFMRDCRKSERISYKLLGLELLVRRLEEAERLDNRT